MRALRYPTGMLNDGAKEQKEYKIFAPSSFGGFVLRFYKKKGCRWWQPFEVSFAKR